MIRSAMVAAAVLLVSVTPLAAQDAGLPRAPMSPVETARYVAEFSAELAFLARQAKLDLLAYLLDMARLEAIRVVQSGGKDV